MKMNKIIGILLAACFLMSVTVAAVSATAPEKGKYGKENERQWGGDDNNYKDKWGDHHKPKFVWKCHTEYKKKLVKIIYKHHDRKPIKIYKWKAVKVCYKVPVHHGHR